MYTIIFLSDEIGAMIPQAVCGGLKLRHDQLLVECVHLNTKCHTLVILCCAESTAQPHPGTAALYKASRLPQVVICDLSVFVMWNFCIAECDPVTVEK